MAIFVFVHDKTVLKEHPTGSTPAIQGDENSASPALDKTATTEIVFSAPLSRATERVTKKPFGINISPDSSPVQPERFLGYHTGADFETFSEEQDADVPIYAICRGPLKVARTASGYGGAAVQECMIEGAEVTVLYGHIHLNSLKAKIGDNLEAGEFLGVLGKAYSIETAGERKHLHLSIHKGNNIDLRGYASKQADLDAWIDPVSLW